MNEIQERAAKLLLLIWRGTPLDLKRRYMNVWEQFENQVRSAAYTTSLPKFLNSLCSKLAADIGKNADDRAEAERILSAGNDRAMLKAMREETTYLVLMVRVWQQELREAWEADHPVEDEPDNDLPLFAEEGNE